VQSQENEGRDLVQRTAEGKATRSLVSRAGQEEVIKQGRGGGSLRSGNGTDRWGCIGWSSNKVRGEEGHKEKPKPFAGPSKNVRRPPTVLQTKPPKKGPRTQGFAEYNRNGAPRLTKAMVLP